MSRPAKNETPPPPKSSPSVPAAAPGRAAGLAPLWPLMLLVLALAEMALSAYQWRELLAVRAGGEAACSVSEAVNCVTVWNSAFASRVHALAGVPVAALGVVWGLVAAVVSVALLQAVLQASRAGRPPGARASAVKLVAAAGLLSCISFAVASAAAGALCPTCLGTYGLVAGFAAVALLKVPGAVMPAGGELGRALALAVVPVLVGYGLVRGLGPATPSANAGLAALQQVGTPEGPASFSAAPASARPSRPLTELERQAAAFIERLPPDQKQALADELAAFRAQPARPAAGFSPRRVAGDADAPLKMVEWTDIKCSHCAALSSTLAELERVLPPGLLSVEARQFPLARACNPLGGGDYETETRCAAARALLCVQDTPGYFEAQEKMFAEQRTLTAERVKQLAAGAGMEPAKLEACMASPQTQARLDEDARYGMAFNLTGTPLVVLNGRKASPYGPLLYVLALARGDVDSPAFAGLPPGRVGHGHAH